MWRDLYVTETFGHLYAIFIHEESWLSHVSPLQGDICWFSVVVEVGWAVHLFCAAVTVGVEVFQFHAPVVFDLVLFEDRNDFLTHFFHRRAVVVVVVEHPAYMIT